MMSPQDVSDSTVASPLSAPGIERSDFHKVAMLLWRRRIFVACTTTIALIFGLLLASLISPSFTSSAVLLPPAQPTSSAAAILGQLGTLGALGGSSLDLKGPSDLYAGFLKSRRIADNLIGRFGLGHVYQTKTMVESRKALAAHTDIEVSKDGLIHINVTDNDPQRASNVANAYVEELTKLNSTLTITEASQRRAFFDRQLEDERRALQTAEDNLRETEHRTGVIQLAGQTQELLEEVATLKAQLTGAEVELQGMRSYATDQNPEVTLTERRVDSLRAQIGKLENDRQRQSGTGDITLSALRAPEDSIEYARVLREVKYHESLYDLLSKQREAARIDEAKSAPILEVIDSAVPPDKKSGPPRMLLTLAAGLAGLLLAVSWTLLSASIGADGVPKSLRTKFAESRWNWVHWPLRDSVRP